MARTARRARRGCKRFTRAALADALDLRLQQLDGRNDVHVGLRAQAALDTAASVGHTGRADAHARAAQRVGDPPPLIGGQRRLELLQRRGGVG
jgi:hypothetical protein